MNLPTKFQVSGIILPRNTGGGNFTPPPLPTSKQAPKKLTQVRLGLRHQTNITMEIFQMLISI